MGPRDPQEESRVKPILNQSYTSTLLDLIGKICPITALISKIDPIIPYIEHIGPTQARNLGPGDSQQESKVQLILNTAHSSALPGLIGKIGPITACIGKIGSITPTLEYIGSLQASGMRLGDLQEESRLQPIVNHTHTSELLGPISEAILRPLQAKEALLQPIQSIQGLYRHMLQGHGTPRGIQSPLRRIQGQTDTQPRSY